MELAVIVTTDAELSTGEGWGCWISKEEVWGLSKDSVEKLPIDEGVKGRLAFKKRAEVTCSVNARAGRAHLKAIVRGKSARCGYGH